LGKALRSEKRQEGETLENISSSGEDEIRKRVRNETTKQRRKRKPQREGVYERSTGKKKPKGLKIEIR